MEMHRYRLSASIRKYEKAFDDCSYDMPQLRYAVFIVGTLFQETTLKLKFFKNFQLTMGVNPIFVDLVAAQYLVLNIDFKPLIFFCFPQSEHPLIQIMNFL